MTLFSTPHRRIAWLVAAAAAVALLDRAFVPPEAAEVAVVGAVTKGRSPSSGGGADATRVSAARSASSTGAQTGAQSGTQADLERIARWQRTRAAASDEGTAAGVDRDGDATPADPFTPVTWAAPAASAARVAPPPPPPPPSAVAPPFPYAYIGGLSDEGIRTLFFTKGERVLAVKAGDVVDAVYRIDEINDKQMKLTYVPMNESAVVALGAAR